jgi:hypothetical protein
MTVDGLFGMAQEGVADGREIEVIGEQIDWWNDVGDLDELTLVADDDLEREAWFGLVQVNGPGQVVGEGL